MTISFKTAYGKRVPVRFATTGYSLTDQSMAPECDINKIMLRWQKTGVLEHRNTFEGQYGDFINVPQDYHSAMNQVIEAEEMFSSLPAKLRKRFGNDPGAYLDFVADPENSDELVKMGLAKAPKIASDGDVLDDVGDNPKTKKAVPEQKKGVPTPKSDPSPKAD